MKENSNLKKIIDLYVEKGLDNTYLHDEMIKGFTNASPEERKEGHEYLNWKLQEEKKNGRDFSKEQPKQYIWIIGLIIILCIVVILIIKFNNKSNNTSYNANSTYTNTYSSNSNNNNNINLTYSNTYSNSNNSNSDNLTTSHYCDASGCTSKGTYTIKGASGKTEYYCYKHYKQMEEYLKIIMGY